MDYLNHPERQKGEIYLSNINTINFNHCYWRTKRLGKIMVNGYSPIFIDASEIQEEINKHPDSFEENFKSAITKAIEEKND